jgi:PAS domain S-box-containing protein
MRSALLRDGLLANRLGAPARSARAYILTACSVAAALVLQTLLSPLLTGAQFITFFPTVILTTLCFGAAAGLAAVGLSAVAALFGQAQQGLSVQEIYSLVLFVAVALLDVGIITALFSATAAARQSETRFRDLLESAPDAFVIVGQDNRIVLVNSQAEALFGREREAMVGQTIDLLIPARLRKAHADNVLRFRAEPRVREMGRGLELRGLRRDGSEFPVEVKLSPFRPTTEGMVSCVVRDVTARKAADEQKMLLIHELNHRVKNTLAIVQSIARQTLRQASDPEAFNAAFSARLIALSRCHDVVTRHDWTNVGLRELVIEQMRPFVGDNPRRLVVAGPEVDLEPGAALALGMTLGELATNAAKYGALSDPDGAIAITWGETSVADAPWLSMVWRETGGPAVQHPAGQGFGTRLIERGLIRGLGGWARLAFDPGGVRCQIEFPLQGVPLDEDLSRLRDRPPGRSAR